jgi:methyl-accepting chemotaxis protein
MSALPFSLAAQGEQRMTVARRLTLAFGAVILVLLGVAGVSLYSAHLLDEAERANVQTQESLTAAGDMLQDMLAMQAGARGFLLSGDERFLAPWEAARKTFDTHLAEAKRLTAGNEAQQRRLDGMKERRTDFEATMQPLIEQRRDVAAGRGYIADLVGDFMQGLDQAAMDGFRALHDEFDKTQAELLATSAATAQRTRSANTVVLISGPLLAVVLALVLGWRITGSIYRQLGGEPELAACVARDIAQGRLDTELALHGSAGDASLMAAMATMREQLVRTVGEVRRNAEGVATASAQIAQGNQDLSHRTEQQASSLEETAASMEELGSTVKHNAENAQQANQLARGASDVAAKGGEVVAQVVRTMRGIEESSRRIADIINVIDGIAFQTNILALNAAVEAARAGEAGRGFAVVAGEVRSLAQRSADAAKEIKVLISDSVSRVDQGSALADQAGHTMEEVVAAIRRVTDLVGEISHASVEQSEGVALVAEAVGNMDHTTQQNAALVEQSAAAAESLRQQAQRLVEAVAVFRLAADSAPAQAQPMPAVARPTQAGPQPALSHTAQVTRPDLHRPPARPAARPAPAPAPLPAPREARHAATGDDGEWASF